MRHFCNVLKQGMCFAVTVALTSTALAITMTGSAFAIQNKPAARQSSNSSSDQSSAGSTAKKTDPITDEFNKYPGLRDEVTRLVTRFTQEIKLPAARSQSRLLPLLPEATAYYLAIPNYGDALHQALTIFQEERKSSTALNDWWQHNMAKDSPEVESDLEKFYQLSQFLGEEIVVSGSDNGSKTDWLLVCAIKKPGVKAFLAKLGKDLSGKSPASMLIYDPATLPAVAPAGSKDKTMVLVRPDFLVISQDLPTLTKANKQLDLRGGRFASTPFGARLNRSYENSAEILAGVDLQKLMRALAKETKPYDSILEATGFSDAKFLIWEQADTPGHAPNHAELSFTGPRRSIASWLASPGHMGGLDFVSPNSPMAFAFRLKNPALMFDDLKAIDEASGAHSMASLGQMEGALNVNLRDALLSKLSGEVIFEIDSSNPETPAWKTILGASDPDGLMQTVTLLLSATNTTPKSYMEDGVTVYSVSSLSGPKQPDLSFAMVDRYLVLASTHEMLAAAIKTHRSGDSLGRSNKLHESMPQGYPVDASALMYQNMGAMLEPMMRQFSPDSAQFLPRLLAGKPSVGALYGEETMIRQASNNSGMGVGTIMVVAAIAIPNLLRSRMAANGAAAAASVRTVNTAQITYMTAYPNRGYAPDLATLGPGGDDANCNDNNVSEKHACLLNERLGGAACAAGTWCSKDGYRFSMSATCKNQLCEEYVVVASPSETSTGTSSYCSVSDGMVRMRNGPPLPSPITATECQKWEPIH